MLTHIFVKDLAIVSSLELDLATGMSALTGETGAGKSILIDALGLALGDKADPHLIRSGCDRAEVIATFDLSLCPNAQSWLSEQDLDDAEECIVRRVLVRGGRSRAYVNGRPATGAQVQGLGEHLVDIHGQHAHQSLLRPAAQRSLLDAYGGHGDTALAVARLYRTYRTQDDRLRRLRTESADREARLDLLRFQVEELDGLGLSGDEIDALDEEQKRLANLGRLQEGSGSLLQQLYDGEPNLHGTLARAAADLEVLSGFDGSLGETHELVEGAAIQIEEAAGNLRHYLDRLELEPGRLEQVESRLAEIHDSARKYRVFPNQIPETLARLRSELERLEQDDSALETLAADCDAARNAFLDAAQRLSGLRSESAGRLGETVTAAMQELGMVGGRFAVQLTTIEPDSAGAHGLDQVELQVSANPGQPVMPLAKVISGGELSRISLAIQVATAECGSIPTLVFDEVDVGIGGRVAEIVGRLLRTLGEMRQVLCVTHLPQVAAQAHNHLQVVKQSANEQTYTSIGVLGTEERVGEIARMLGGKEITRKTLAHAREMITRSQTVGQGPKAESRGD